MSPKATSTLVFAGFLAGCAATPVPTSPPPPDPDGFLYFNDAQLYRSAMRRCAARLPAYAGALEEAERVLADARARYAARGGRPDRADLARIYARSDRELTAELRGQSDAEVASACAQLAEYHRRNTAAYASS